MLLGHYNPHPSQLSQGVGRNPDLQTPLLAPPACVQVAGFWGVVLATACPGHWNVLVSIGQGPGQDARRRASLGHISEGAASSLTVGSGTEMGSVRESEEGCGRGGPRRGTLSGTGSGIGPSGGMQVRVVVVASPTHPGRKPEPLEENELARVGGGEGERAGQGGVGVGLSGSGPR